MIYDARHGRLTRDTSSNTASEWTRSLGNLAPTSEPCLGQAARIPDRYLRNVHARRRLPSLPRSSRLGLPVAQLEMEQRTLRGCIFPLYPPRHGFLVDRAGMVAEWNNLLRETRETRVQFPLFKHCLQVSSCDASA